MTGAVVSTIVATSDPFAPLSGTGAWDAATIELLLGEVPGTIQALTAADGREGSAAGDDSRLANPQPASGLLLALGLAGLTFYSRKR